MTLSTSLVTLLFPISKLKQKVRIKCRYCGGTTHANNATNIASGDYSYLSQFSSNFVAYLITQRDPLKKRFDASKYPAEGSVP